MACVSLNYMTILAIFWKNSSLTDLITSNQNHLRLDSKQTLDQICVWIYDTKIIHNKLELLLWNLGFILFMYSNCEEVSDKAMQCQTAKLIAIFIVLNQGHWWSLGQIQQAKPMVITICHCHCIKVRSSMKSAL